MNADPEAATTLDASDSAQIPPSSSFAMGAGDVLGVLLICVIVVWYGRFPLWHSDIWGHELYGQWILDHGRLPDQEPFTPFADKSVRPSSVWWLTQVIYASLARLGDAMGGDAEVRLARIVELLRAFHLVMFAGQFLFLWLAYRRISGSAGWANAGLAILVMANLALLDHIVVQRPQALGFFCFAVLLYVVSRPEISRRGMIGLPVLFAFWANLHASFAAGLVFLFMTVLAIWLRRLRQPKETRHQDRSLQRVSIAFALSVAAVMLNPRGPAFYLEVATFADRPNVRFLMEWRPMAIYFGWTGLFTRLLMLWAVVLIGWALSGFAHSTLLLAALPFGIWPIWQARVTLWWLILVPWLIAAFGPFIFQRLGLFKHFEPPERNPRKTLVAASLVVLALLLLPPIQELMRYRLRPLDQTISAATPWRLGFELNAAPAASGHWLPGFAQVVREDYQGHYHGTIFCTEVLGDYLLRVAPPDCPVIGYTHADMFPHDFWLAWMRTMVAQADWRGFLTEHRVNMVVVEPDRCYALAQALREDPEWQIVLDEGNIKALRQPGEWLFIAVRKKPL